MNKIISCHPKCYGESDFMFDSIGSWNVNRLMLLINENSTLEMSGNINRKLYKFCQKKISEKEGSVLKRPLYYR